MSRLRIAYLIHALGGLLLVVALMESAHAAPTFRVNKSYPTFGLSLRTLGGSTPEPLPQPRTYAYTFTSSQGDSSRRELYSLHELWYATQHLGQWRDPKDNLMILAAAKQRKPQIESPIHDHIARETFTEAVQGSAEASAIESLEELALWLAEFTGLQVEAPQKARGGFSLQAAYFFPVSDATTIACAFKPRVRSAVGGGANTIEWFVAVIKVADDTPLSKVRRDFEAQFLASIAVIPRVKEAQTVSSAPKQTEDLQSTADPRQSRKAAHQSIANMQGWWHADTPEYTFLTDVRSATGQRLIREVQSELTALRTAFVKLVPPLVPELDIGIIRIFESAADYKKYIGEDVEWSSGCWSPARRELVIQSQGRDRAHTLAIIRHEAFHQYLFYATNMRRNAQWYNEGHACLVEEIALDSRGNVTILENQRSAFLLANLEAVTKNLPQTLSAQRHDFYSTTAQQRQLNYATAWALVYFLRKGVPTLQLKVYENILNDYLGNLALLKDGQAATEKAFEGIDMVAFQRDFNDAWRRRRNDMRRHNPLR